MGKQSARMVMLDNGVLRDHKDIWFDGHYHKAMYIGAQKVWEKLGSGWYYKYYADHPSPFDTFVQNGKRAVCAKRYDRYVYITEDFINFIKIDLGTYSFDGEEYTVSIKEIFVLNGICYIDTYLYYEHFDNSMIFRSDDFGESWSTINTLIFDTNGFKASIKLIGGRYKYRTIKFSIVNNAAYMYLENTSSTEEYDFNVEGNDYAHILGGIYKSTDCINWKSLNTHYLESNINDEIHLYPLSEYSITPLTYYEGYYYVYGKRYDISIDFLESIRNPCETGKLWKTKDFTNFHKVSDEFENAPSINKFGEYLYIGRKGLTKDFVNYVDIEGFLDIPQKQTIISDEYRRYEFHYEVNKKSEIPFTMASESEDYIFTYVYLSDIGYKYTLGSSSSELSYGEGSAQIIIDKKSMKVIDIFMVYNPVYIYGKDVVLGKADYDVSKGWREEKKPVYIEGQDIAVFFTYALGRHEASTDGGAVIIKKEE